MQDDAKDACVLRLDERAELAVDDVLLSHEPLGCLSLTIPLSATTLISTMGRQNILDRAIAS